MVPKVAAVLVSLSLAGCSSAPDDISGTYTTTLTNGANTCPGTWTVGAVGNVTLQVTQSGSDATIDVAGVSGFYLDAAVGSSTFDTKVSGADVSGTLLGTTEQNVGSCMFTWKAEVSGTLKGDTLTGSVKYTPQTNGNADCASMSVNGCSRTQTFIGSHPPSS